MSSWGPDGVTCTLSLDSTVGTRGWVGVGVGGDGGEIGHFRLASAVRMGSSCHRHTTELLCCRRFGARLVY